MDFRSLDDSVRELMVQELDLDLASGRLYLSRRLTAAGQARWPELLREALATGTPESLAGAIRDLMQESESRNRNGRVVVSRVPQSAPTTLAEGEYNRFYIRAACVRATREGRKVEIYRARPVTSPRPESEALVGTLADPAALLRDLRENTGAASVSGIPAGPHSGLSVFIV